METGEDTIKNTVERMSLAGNQAFKDSIEKTLGALNEEGARGAPSFSTANADQTFIVTTGGCTSPKDCSTPSSSRWPSAWQPEAKPYLRGSDCSRWYA